MRLDAAEASRIVASSSSLEVGRDADRFLIGIEEGLGFQDEEYMDLEPNLLVVQVRRARDLVALDANLSGEHTSDPYVKLTCDGIEHR